VHNMWLIFLQWMLIVTSMLASTYGHGLEEFHLTKGKKYTIQPTKWTPPDGRKKKKAKSKFKSGGNKYRRQKITIDNCECEHIHWGSSGFERLSLNYEEEFHEVEVWWTEAEDQLKDVLIGVVDFMDMSGNMEYLKKTGDRMIQNLEFHIGLINGEDGMKMIKWGKVVVIEDDNEVKWEEPIPLNEIDLYLGKSIIQFNTKDGLKLWGLVEQDGTISAYGTPKEFPYTICRLFFNYLVQTHQQQSPNDRIDHLRIVWEENEVEIPQEKLEVDWFVPTWLPQDHWSKVTWKVVKIKGVGTAVVRVDGNLDVDVMEIEIVLKVSGKTIKQKYKVKVDQYYLYLMMGSRNDTTGKWEWPEWKRLSPLAQLPKEMEMTIVHWNTPEGNAWGLINTQGEIIGYGLNNERFEETITRLYLQWRVKEVLDKGYVVRRYKFIWNGELLEQKHTINEDTLLIPTWLENPTTNWIVVNHLNKLVMVYVGGEVVTQYGDDVTRDEPELPILADKDDTNLGCLTDYYGKCGKMWHRQSSCMCKENCECQNPYHIYKKCRNEHPLLPFTGLAEAKFISKAGRETPIRRDIGDEVIGDIDYTV